MDILYPLISTVVPNCADRICTMCPDVIPAGGVYIRFDYGERRQRVCLKCWRALEVGRVA